MNRLRPLYILIISILCLCLISPLPAVDTEFDSESQTAPPSGEMSPDAPKGKANPFIFMWGRSYERITSELPADSIVARKPGQWIQFKQGDLVCRYSFYQRKRIKSVRVVQNPRTVRTVRTFASRAPAAPRPAVEYEAAEEASEARLFAVSIYYAPIALDAQYRNKIEDVLTGTYGRIMNRTRSHFDLENAVTFVRAYLENYRKRPYLKRLVFSSKELSREMKENQRQLQNDATARLRTEIQSGRPVMASNSESVPDTTIEETSMGYMDSAGDLNNDSSASLLEEKMPAEETAAGMQENPPALLQSEMKENPPVAALEESPEKTEEKTTELQPDPVEEMDPMKSPAGLKSEALPLDFAGDDTVENPFELP